ncbi:MAG: hypothetical protein NW200_07490 [Hyphomonadaceae bacterium]|nr:hypothetical protein [Hyphomonadaceae bacterium]
MDRNTDDLHRTISYSALRHNLGFLGVGLLCIGLGILLVYIKIDAFSSGSQNQLMLIATFATGAVAVLYALYQMLVSRKPMLVLSPEGLCVRIPGVKSVLIPWREVRGVDTADISADFRGQSTTFKDVTVVLVSRSFYKRHIHVASWLIRGPGWDAHFVPAGDTVQVALHHKVLLTTAEELRTAVEARWHAFRDAAPTSGVPQVGRRCPD